MLPDMSLGVKDTPTTLRAGFSCFLWLRSSYHLMGVLFCVIRCGGYPTHPSEACRTAAGRQSTTASCKPGSKMTWTNGWLHVAWPWQLTGQLPTLVNQSPSSSQVTLLPGNARQGYLILMLTCHSKCDPIWRSEVPLLDPQSAC